MSRTPKLISASLVMLLTGLACSFTVELPSFGGEADQSEVDRQEIAVPAPDDSPAEVTLQFAAGRLEISPRSGGGLIQGTARYNVTELKPELSANGSRVRLSTGDVADLRDLDLDLDFRANVVNQWELTLSDFPMTLAILGGAFQGDLELGGLTLSELSISSGASDVEVSFSEPNQASMSQLRFQTGASQAVMRGLANANFERMTFDGGAGDFTLDFSGELQQDAEVSIDAAFSQLRLIVPSGRQVRIRMDGALADIELPSSFEQDGGWFEQSGTGPELTIQIDLGAGTLEVRHP